MTICIQHHIDLYHWRKNDCRRFKNDCHRFKNDCDRFWKDEISTNTCPIQVNDGSFEPSKWVWSIGNLDSWWWGPLSVVKFVLHWFRYGAFREIVVSVGLSRPFHDGMQSRRCHFISNQRTGSIQNGFRFAGSLGGVLLDFFAFGGRQCAPLARVAHWSQFSTMCLPSNSFLTDRLRCFRSQQQSSLPVPRKAGTAGDASTTLIGSISFVLDGRWGRMIAQFKDTLDTLDCRMFGFL